MNEILIAVGMPMLRSIGGWASYALKDGKISKFEYNKLVETVIRTGVIGTMIYFGAEGYGLEVDAIASSTTAVILDLVVSKTKK